MDGLFLFPNPVNETSGRLIAGAVAALAAPAIAFQQGRLLTVLAYGFVARALTGPTLSPLGLFATRVVTPRLNISHRYMRIGLVPTHVCEECAAVLARSA